METYFKQQAIGANKRTRTRGALIDGAIDVFAEKGFDEASISEIAAVAGMANGTFYNHFKDKEALAAATASAIALEIAERLDERMVDLESGIERVVAASFAFIRLAAEHQPWGAVLLEQFQRRPAAGAAAMEYMRADIQLAVEQRGLDVEVDDFLLEQLSALMIAALRLQLGHGYQQAQLLRTCEYILRILGLNPKQARQGVEGVTRHNLLGTSASLGNFLTA